MPFTPFHMGPGILIKALLQGGFSLMVFGWAQIIMDIQPLLVLLTGEGHLHGFSHTYLGALLLGAFSALSGKYLAEFGLYLLGLNPQRKLRIAWWVTLLSAYIGTFSHVLLDSVMHADLQPFYPFDPANPLLGIISAGNLYLACLITGLIGSVLYFAGRLVRKYHSHNRSG